MRRVMINTRTEWWRSRNLEAGGLPAEGDLCGPATPGDCDGGCRRNRSGPGRPGPDQPGPDRTDPGRQLGGAAERRTGLADARWTSGQIASAIRGSASAGGFSPPEGLALPPRKGVSVMKKAAAKPRTETTAPQRKTTWVPEATAWK